MFSGQNHKLHSDLKSAIMYTDEYHWRVEEPQIDPDTASTEQYKNLPKHLQRQSIQRPKERIGSSLVQFNENMVVFGGQGDYQKSVKKRECFNDLFYYSIEGNYWTEVPYQRHVTPMKRSYHTAAKMGQLMLIQGGFDSENQKLLSDYQLFDLEHQKWLKVEIKSEKDLESRAHLPLGAIQMHTMTAVFSKKNQKELYEEETRDMQNRMIWFEDDSIARFEQGFYIFGGLDSDGPSNEVYLLQPDYDKNYKNLIETSRRAEIEKASLGGNQKKISKNKLPPHFYFDLIQTYYLKERNISERINGKPPLPRYAHQSLLFTNGSY